MAPELSAAEAMDQLHRLVARATLSMHGVATVIATAGLAVRVNEKHLGLESGGQSP